MWGVRGGPEPPQPEGLITPRVPRTPRVLRTPRVRGGGGFRSPSPRAKSAPRGAHNHRGEEGGSPHQPPKTSEKQAK